MGKRLRMFFILGLLIKSTWRFRKHTNHSLELQSLGNLSTLTFKDKGGMACLTIGDLISLCLQRH